MSEQTAHKARLFIRLVHGLKVLLACAVELVLVFVSAGGRVKSAGLPSAGGRANVVFLRSVTIYRHPTTTLGGCSRERTLPARETLHTDQDHLSRKQLVYV